MDTVLVLASLRPAFCCDTVTVAVTCQQAGFGLEATSSIDVHLAYTYIYVSKTDGAWHTSKFEYSSDTCTTERSYNLRGEHMYILVRIAIVHLGTRATVATVSTQNIERPAPRMDTDVRAHL